MGQDINSAWAVHRTDLGGLPPDLALEVDMEKDSRTLISEPLHSPIVDLWVRYTILRQFEAIVMTGSWLSPIIEILPSKNQIYLVFFLVILLILPLP